MDKKSFVLAALATSQEAVYSPVQIQKLFFLIDKNIPELVGGPHFNFKPYDYGPFDRNVYDQVNVLATEGLVTIVEVPGKQWVKYSLTNDGFTAGQKTFASLKPKARNYMAEASKFVLGLSFAQLVSAIYKAYPDMKENSVF